jgi:hypothetical protein
MIARLHLQKFHQLVPGGKYTTSMLHPVSTISLGFIDAYNLPKEHITKDNHGNSSQQIMVFF